VEAQYSQKGQRQGSQWAICLISRRKEPHSKDQCPAKHFDLFNWNSHQILVKVWIN
jgi:hypothetical protein